MKLRLRFGDPALVALALVASLVGVFAIWDSGYARGATLGLVVPREAQDQVVYLAVCLGAALVCMLVPPGAWRRLGWLAYGACLVGLLLVKVPGLGVEINGATRWISVPYFGTVQPAEFAKLGAVLFLAAVLAARKPWQGPKRQITHWAQRLDWVWVPKLKRAFPFLLVMVLVLLIEAEPDLATAMVIAFSAVAMLVLAGVTWRSLVALGALGAVLVGAMLVSEPYRIERMLNHASRWSAANIDGIGYQTTQSEAAMARGGLTGVGIGEGRAKHTLPAPTTDFVVTTVAEETGFLGMLGLVALMGALVWRLMALARRTADPMARLFMGGAAAWIAVQSTVNVMMANGFAPPIGIPLPFISAGGSSLLALWMTVGIAQSLASAPDPARQENGEDETGRDGWRDWRARVSRA